jgi:hypothetical protein
VAEKVAVMAEKKAEKVAVVAEKKADKPVKKARQQKIEEPVTLGQVKLLEGESSSVELNKLVSNYEANEKQLKK